MLRPSFLLPASALEGTSHLASRVGKLCAAHPRLACRLRSCAPVGRVQDRPKRELRPVRGRAPPALAHPLPRPYLKDISSLAGAGGGNCF